MFEWPKQAVLFHLYLVHDFAPASVGRYELQYPLVLLVTIHVPGQSNVLVVHRNVHISAAENRIAAQ